MKSLDVSVAMYRLGWHMFVRLVQYSMIDVVQFPLIARFEQFDGHSTVEHHQEAVWMPHSLSSDVIYSSMMALVAKSFQPVFDYGKQMFWGLIDKWDICIFEVFIQIQFTITYRFLNPPFFVIFPPHMLQFTDVLNSSTSTTSAYFGNTLYSARIGHRTEPRIGEFGLKPKFPIEIKHCLPFVISLAIS